METYSLETNLYPVFLIVFHAVMTYDSLYLTLKYANVRYMHALTFTLYTLIMYSNPMLARHITSHIWDGRKMVLKERSQRIKKDLCELMHNKNTFYINIPQT